MNVLERIQVTLPEAHGGEVAGMYRRDDMDFCFLRVRLKGQPKGRKISMFGFSDFDTYPYAWQTV